MSELADHIQKVYQAIIDQGRQPELLPGREMRPARPGGFMTLCPFHEDKNPSLSIGANKPVYNCFGCNASGDWISLLMAVDGLDFSQALERLERIAGVPARSRDPRAAEKYKETRRRADILTEAQAFFIECLKTDKETQEYLKGRGYTQADIEAAGFGAFPGSQKTIAHLTERGFDAGEIYSPSKYPKEPPGGALPWINSRGDYRLTIPYFDATRGAVIAIMGRLTRSLKDGEKEQDKYKPISDMAGLKAENLYNIDRAKGAEILLVEGLLDAAILTARGIPAAGLGGAALLDGQLAQAIRYGVQRFIFALDNDPAGTAGTRAAILKTWKASKRAYVVTLPAGIKDPDELVKKSGIESFRAALDQRELAPRWITRRTIEEMPKADIYQILDALKPLMIAADPIDQGEIMGAARGALEMPENVLNDFIGMQRDIEAGNQIKTETGRIIRGAQGILNDGDAGAAIDYLMDQARALKPRAAKYESPFYPFAQYLEDERHEPAGIKTGFKTLDEMLLIPSGAIAIIAARPMHGKTTFLLNLMLNQAELAPEKAFFFFSYEQPRKQLMRRLLMCKSGHVVDQNLNYIRFGEYLKYNQTNHPAIEAAKAQLADMVQGERLALIDRPYFVDELAGVLSSFAGRYQIGGVYIDYIQKIKIKGRYQSRQAEIQAISGQILEAAIALKIPIILGAQVNRTVESLETLTADKMREAGDIEQDANIVLGLWNKEKGTDDSPGRARQTELSIKILKNRDGQTTRPNDPKVLIFDQPIFKITDSQGDY